VTVVVGLAHNGAVWFGADSRAEDDCAGGRLLAQPKVWRRGPYLIGAAGSMRFADVVRHEVTLPAPPSRASHRHVAVVVVPAIREALKAAGYRLQSRGSDGGEDAGGELLVGFNGRVFSIDGEFQVQEERSGFDCVGSGASTALGALHATPGLPPRQRVIRALEAAELFAVGVRRPWRILQLRGRP
jgi:hypothetical protein